jgi:hypothetical protein
LLSLLQKRLLSGGIVWWKEGRNAVGLVHKDVLQPSRGKVPGKQVPDGVIAQTLLLTRIFSH